MSASFDMFLNLYRRCKYVVYGSHGPPMGNHAITCAPKLPYNFLKFLLKLPTIDLRLRWSLGSKNSVITCCTEYQNN